MEQEPKQREPRQQTKDTIRRGIIHGAVTWLIHRLLDTLQHLTWDDIM